MIVVGDGPGVGNGLLGRMPFYSVTKDPRQVLSAQVRMARRPESVFEK
jgi:hypothetical protein